MFSRVKQPRLVKSINYFDLAKSYTSRRDLTGLSCQAKPWLAGVFSRYWPMYQCTTHAREVRQVEQIEYLKTSACYINHQRNIQR